MTVLSDLLVNAKGDRSVDQLIADAERRGLEINHTARATIYKALKGDHAKSPREETLQLFADVFHLGVQTVRTAADKPAGELGPWTPVSEAAQLDRDQRLALDQLIKAIVRGGAAGDSQIATSGAAEEPAAQSDDLKKRRRGRGAATTKRAARPDTK